jgi:dTMP kinase
MARFRFRLERVLGVRRLQEEIARAAYTDVLSRARSAESLHQSTKRDVTRNLEELTRLLEARSIDPDAILVEQFTLDQAQKRVPPARKRAEVARAAAERERAVWEERNRALKSLENLRERARIAFRGEEEKVENARLDEQALIRAARAAEAQNFSPRSVDEAERTLNGP